MWIGLDLLYSIGETSCQYLTALFENVTYRSTSIHMLSEN